MHLFFYVYQLSFLTSICRNPWRGPLGEARFARANSRGQAAPVPFSHEITLKLATVFLLLLDHFIVDRIKIIFCDKIFISYYFNFSYICFLIIIIYSIN